MSYEWRLFVKGTCIFLKNTTIYHIHKKAKKNTSIPLLVGGRGRSVGISEGQEEHHESDANASVAKGLDVKGKGADRE